MNYRRPWGAVGVILLLLAAWIGLVVFGARYPRRAEAAVPTADGVKSDDVRSIAKSYVVVREFHRAKSGAGDLAPTAELPIASSLPKPVASPASSSAVPLGKPTPQQSLNSPTPASRSRVSAKLLPVPAPQQIDKPADVRSALSKQDRREVGRELMGTDGKREGEVPVITMDYRRRLGWPEYVRAMVRLGGMFLVFDKQTERILAQADFLSNSLLDISKDSLVGMSPRIREIHSESAIAEVMEKSRQKYGPTANTLILLLPLNVDFDIVGGIAQQLAEHNIEAMSVSRVLGEYEQTPDGLRLHAQEIVGHDGRATPVDFTIDLGDLLKVSHSLPKFNPHFSHGGITKEVNTRNNLPTSLAVRLDVGSAVSLK